MTNTDANALARCQKMIASVVKGGFDLSQAKLEIRHMLAAQPDNARRTVSLAILDRFLSILPAGTVGSKSLAYEIGREIDRRAKLVRMRDLRTVH